MEGRNVWIIIRLKLDNCLKTGKWRGKMFDNKAARRELSLHVNGWIVLSHAKGWVGPGHVKGWVVLANAKGRVVLRTTLSLKWEDKPPPPSDLPYSKCYY